MAKLSIPGLPAGAKVTGIRLRVANNGGVIVCIENRVKRDKSANETYGDDYTWSPDVELAYTDYSEAEDIVKSAASNMGITVKGFDDDEDELEHY